MVRKLQQNILTAKLEQKKILWAFSLSFIKW